MTTTYLVNSHLGGYYFSSDDPDDIECICETCGDCDCVCCEFDDDDADDAAESILDYFAMENGIVTGVATGIAAISASADGFQATCTVRVHTSVQEVSLNITEQTLYREQTAEPFQLKAAIVPGDADDPKLIYTSDNPLVANVSDTGLVTMTGGYGTAVISVEAASGAKATCTVNVIVPTTENEERTQP